MTHIDNTQNARRDVGIIAMTKLTPQELDERIEHMAHDIARAYGQQAPFMAISPFTKQLLSDFAEAITPERLEPKPEDYDGFGDYSHVVRMQQTTIDTIQANAKELLG